MGSKQKTVSINEKVYKKYDDLFMRNHEGLKLIGINTTAELIRVVLNLGEQHVPELLEGIGKLRMKSKESPKA